MTALSFLGIIFALAFLCFVMFKGSSPLVVVPIAGIIVCVLSGLDPITVLTSTFTSQIGTLFASLIPMFLTGSILGICMEQCGCARSIARFLRKLLGAKNACWIVVIGTGLLSYGGCSFGAYFIMYPIGVYLCSEANYDRNIILGCLLCGSWTFAMTGPFAPVPINVYAINALGTSPSAGLIPGLAASVFMLVAGCLYLQWQCKSWQKKGRVFTDNELLATLGSMDDTANTDPHVLISITPILVLVVLYNVVGINVGGSTFFALVACIILNLRRFDFSGWWKIATDGAVKSVVPCLNLAFMGGIGAVIALTPAYTVIVNFLGSVDVNPYIIVILAANLLAFVLGSASGSVALILSSMAPLFEKYIAMGYDAGNIHRLMVLAAGGLDSLPCNGSISSLCSLFNFTYKDAYFPVFMTCTLFPIIGCVCLALPLAMLGFT